MVERNEDLGILAAGLCTHGGSLAAVSNRIHQRVSDGIIEGEQKPALLLIERPTSRLPYLTGHAHLANAHMLPGAPAALLERAQCYPYTSNGAPECHASTSHIALQMLNLTLGQLCLL